MDRCIIGIVILLTFILLLINIDTKDIILFTLKQVAGYISILKRIEAGLFKEKLKLQAGNVYY